VQMYSVAMNLWVYGQKDLMGTTPVAGAGGNSKHFSTIKKKNERREKKYLDIEYPYGLFTSIICISCFIHGFGGNHVPMPHEG